MKKSIQISSMTTLLLPNTSSELATLCTLSLLMTKRTSPQNGGFKKKALSATLRKLSIVYQPDRTIFLV